MYAICMAQRSNCTQNSFKSVSAHADQMHYMNYDNVHYYAIHITTSQFIGKPQPPASRMVVITNLQL